MTQRRGSVAGLGASWSVVLLAAVAWGEGVAGPVGWPVGAFVHEGEALWYEGAGWSVRAEAGRGWVSLRVGEGEMLASGEAWGGIAFRQGERWITYFPDLSNIAHDDQVGRMGTTGDGLHVVRVTPRREGTGLELYAGYNDAAARELVLLLAEGVRVESEAGEGDAKVLTLTHPTGGAVRVMGQCSVATVTDPSGVARQAVVVATKGHAANSVRVEVVGSQAWPVPPVVKPRFAVRSSDDPAKALGPTLGVTNPIYTKDTKLSMAVVFGWKGDGPFRGYAEVEAKHALGPRHYYQRVELADVTPDASGNITARFEPRFTMPGVSDVWARLVDADHRLVWTDRYRMGYELEAYRPRIVAPDDFKAFWDRTLSELRAHPLDARTQRVAAFEDHPEFEVYQVTFNGWEGRPVHAMLFVPRAGQRPLPAIVTAHPGATGFGINKRADGVYGSKIKHDKRFVTIQPLIRGHEPDAKDIPFNHPWWGPLEDRDTYVARAWYCAMVRSVDYLATRPELVDLGRVVAMGGSQGGALALVTAGLDERIVGCFADCPSNCQPSEIMHHYGSFGPSRGVVPPGRTVAEVEALLSYYNPVNFAPYIRGVTHVGSNIGDLTVHSMGPLAAYHNLTGLSPQQKGFHPGFTHFHGSGPGLGAARGAFLTQLTGP